MGKNPDLKKIIDDYESAGLIVIKLSQEELLDGDRPTYFQYREIIYPDVKEYLRLLSGAYASNLERNGLNIDANVEIEKFSSTHTLPKDFGLIYSMPSMNPTTPYNSFIEMITGYKEGLERRMGRQKFSKQYKFNLCIVADEMIVNAFKHGNGADISKQIEVNEVYMRGCIRQGYVLIVRDSGVHLLTKEHIDAHKPQIDPATGKTKLTTSKRGFAIIDGLSQRSWALPYEYGNSVAAHMFEDIPKLI